MKFLLRSHYCNNCKKRIFFLRFTSKKFVETELKCNICNKKVISFWEEVNKKFILPLIIGIAFFATAFSFSLWRYSENEVLPRDILIIVLSIVLASSFAIYGLKYRNKNEFPDKSDHSIRQLEEFRKQSFFVVLWTFIGILLSIIFDIIIWFIWEGISILINYNSN